MAQDDAEYVMALDALTGRELWRVRSDSSYFGLGYHGPRGTPAVYDDVVYTVGASGKLMAVTADSGEVAWSCDLVRDVGGAKPRWGYATSPLIDGDRVFVEPGGGQGNSLAAFHRRSGELLWRSYTDPAGYSSPVATRIGGSVQILFFTARHVVGVSAGRGRALWEIAWETEHDVNAATPVFISPQRVFVSSGFNTGGALLEIRSTGDSFAVAEVWKSRAMRNLFSTCTFFEGYLYGFDEDGLKCLKAATGEERWCQSGFGKASLIIADRKLLILSDEGELVMANASPSGFVPLARAQVLSGRSWTSPALAHGRLYLRSETEAVCLDVAE